MSWASSVTSWLPTLLVIIATAAALTTVGSPPATPRARRLWIAGVLFFGLLAVAGTVWQGRKATEEVAGVSGTTASSEPLAGERSKLTVADLTKHIRALEDRVRELEASRRARVVPPEIVDKLAAYLRQFGRRRVIVSCAPDDIEAYQYANQVFNILKAAHWEVQGPERTKIFGDVRAIGINLYVHADDRSDTVKILTDGFARFNIPYQGKVTPSQAIPDSETVELFIGAQPPGQAEINVD